MIQISCLTVESTHLMMHVEPADVHSLLTQELEVLIKFCNT